MKQEIFKTVVLFVFLPLLAGAVFYFLFCPEVIFVKKIKTALGIDFHINVNASGLTAEILRLIRFYFPDMLWGYALAAVIFLFINSVC